MAARSSALGLVLVAVAAATGCGVPSPLLLCHNGNCAGDGDPARDDTLAALSDSLALDEGGRPPFDGVELDTVWVADQARCAFAHDPTSARSSADAADAAALVAAYLEATDRPSWNGGRFVFQIELKADDDASPDAASAHAECALDMVDQIAAAAAARATSLDVVFDSARPALLRAVAARPRYAAGWPGAAPALSADFGGPAGVNSYTPALADYAGVDLDIAEFHAGWMTDTELEALRAMELDLSVWMFDASTEVLVGVERVDPSYVVTGQARLVRRWLER
jgi:hypothetical protein